MINPNSTYNLKWKVLNKLSNHILNDRPVKDLDRIPYTMVDEMDQSYRCCKYKDRAILKYRMMAAMGFAVEDEQDELKPLAEYYGEAIEKDQVPETTLTVISEACSSCPGARYYVSDICRGCVARPCVGICPKEAVSIKNGRSVIDGENCIKCGKCAKVCPYGAILRIPVPCEEACPVGAISKDKNDRENIDYTKCISCGKCMTSCPFGAIMGRSHIVQVLNKMKKGDKIAAMYAPSIAGQLPGSLNQINEALLQLGFSAVYEVATGADETVRQEGAELLERLEKGETLMTTSCCPAYVEAVRKHVPELLPMVSDTPSPMELTGRMIKKQDSGVKTVFIGPCTAKKEEAFRSEAVDYVMTFEELGALLTAADIDVAEMSTEGVPATDLLPGAHKAGRSFAVSRGVSNSVAAYLQNPPEVIPFCMEGLDRKQIKLLKLYAKGNTPGNFLEVMACEGGCVAGPGTICQPSISRKKVAAFAEEAPELNTAEKKS